MDIRSQLNEVLKQHKGLKSNIENNVIEGTIYLDEGDAYDVRIEIANYPLFFPSVHELDGRIPIKPDRHVYTDTGALCFTTIAKSQILLKTEISSLLLFVNEILIKYLQNNSYYEINDKYFDEDYSHDSLGILESYQDILGIEDVYLIARVILDRILNKKITIRDRCYCGSGSSLKKCDRGRHNLKYKLFRKIDKSLLQHDFENHIYKFLELDYKSVTNYSN